MDSWTTRKTTTRICGICNNSFEKKIGLLRYCSPECSKLAHLKYHKEHRKASVENTLRSIIAGCKNRAKRKGLECDITSEYVLDLLNKQNGLCSVTGIKLESSTANTKFNSSPWTVTIDRKDSNKGYTKDNIHLVCYMYNSCKNRWSHEQVIQMCKGVLKN